MSLIMASAITTILTAYISALTFPNQAFAQGSGMQIFVHTGHTQGFPGMQILSGHEAQVGKIVAGHEAQLGKVLGSHPGLGCELVINDVCLDRDGP